MSKCYAQFHYGTSYGCPEADEYEVFSSITAVETELRKRPNNPYYPCIELETMECFIFLGEPTGLFPCDRYPDYVVRIGPRGGIRRENC